MKRIALLIVVAAVAALGAVGTASSTTVGTAPIFRNTTHSCAFGGDDNGDLVGHFYAIVDNGRIRGTVTLTGVARNSTFAIVLVQNPFCGSQTVGTIVTDGHGNGKVDFNAAISPGAHVAWVATSHDGHLLASSVVSVA